MRVRILTSVATKGASYRRGQIIPNLDDSTALDWISRGMAEEIESETFETAEAPTYETAESSPNRRRRRR